MGSNAPMLSLEPKSKPRRVNTIEQWTSAFQVFVGVYTSRFQMCAPALMKYGDVVRDLAARGGGWCYYDENFRYSMQEQHDNLSWGEVHWELWLPAQHSQVNKFNLQSTSTSVIRNSTASQSFLKDFCWRYHEGQFCGGCAFKHQCFKCGAKHVATKCSFRLSSSKPAYIPSTPGSDSANPNKGK